MSGSLELRIALPAWVADFLAGYPAHYRDDQSAMALAIDLARENIRQRTGGPFGAVVLASTSGELISAGMNLVLTTRCSIAHAEMVAIAFAQRALGTHDLASAVPGGCTLVSSAEPCAMCLGAVPWAGVQRLVCGARDEDVRAAGFDEGDKPLDWPERFAKRGIVVTTDCLRGPASAVVHDYVRGDGLLY